MMARIEKRTWFYLAFVSNKFSRLVLMNRNNFYLPQTEQTLSSAFTAYVIRLESRHVYDTGQLFFFLAARWDGTASHFPQSCIHVCPLSIRKCHLSPSHVLHPFVSDLRDSTEERSSSFTAYGLISR